MKPTMKDTYNDIFTKINTDNKKERIIKNLIPYGKLIFESSQLQELIKNPELKNISKETRKALIDFYNLDLNQVDDIILKLSVALDEDERHEYKLRFLDQTGGFADHLPKEVSKMQVQITEMLIELAPKTNMNLLEKLENTSNEEVFFKLMCHCIKFSNMTERCVKMLIEKEWDMPKTHVDQVITILNANGEQSVETLLKMLSSVKNGIYIFSYLEKMDFNFVSPSILQMLSDNNSEFIEIASKCIDEGRAKLLLRSALLHNDSTIKNRANELLKAVKKNDSEMQRKEAWFKQNGCDFEV